MNNSLNDVINFYKTVLPSIANNINILCESHSEGSIIEKKFYKLNIVAKLDDKLVELCYSTSYVSFEDAAQRLLIDGMWSSNRPINTIFYAIKNVNLYRYDPETKIISEIDKDLSKLKNSEVIFNAIVKTTGE